MKRTSTEQTGIFFGLIALTVGLRLYFQYLPNFAPVAAVAMFSGYYFTSRRAAFLVPVISMLITDALIGGYQPMLMLTVYSLLALPVMFRGPCVRVLTSDDRTFLRLELRVDCSVHR